MAKKDKLEQLDKDSRKRLEKLTDEWDKAPCEWSTCLPSDLRLLLENFTPLQDLIRQIVAPALTHPPATPFGEAGIQTAAPETYAEDAQELQNIQQALEQAHAELADERERLAQAATDLNACNAELTNERERLAQAATDLNACNAQVDKLLKEKGDCKQEIKALKDERKQLRNQLQQTQDALAAAENRSSATPELALLRRDPQLAQEMNLTDLPADDTQALIQAVAVLAQIDNVKRLWTVLKDRCEAEQRPATEDERTLLQTALAWHNHNWRSLPYRLIDTAPASAYDYENQQRSRQVTKGETVAALHLPGIADSSGKALCKALVMTK